MDVWCVRMETVPASSMGWGYGAGLLDDDGEDVGQAGCMSLFENEPRSLARSVHDVHAHSEAAAAGGKMDQLAGALRAMEQSAPLAGCAVDVAPLASPVDGSGGKRTALDALGSLYADDQPHFDDDADGAPPCDLIGLATSPFQPTDEPSYCQEFQGFQSKESHPDSVSLGLSESELMYKRPGPLRGKRRRMMRSAVHQTSEFSAVSCDDDAVQTKQGPPSHGIEDGEQQPVLSVYDPLYDEAFAVSEAYASVAESNIPSPGPKQPSKSDRRTSPEAELGQQRQHLSTMLDRKKLPRKSPRKWDEQEEKRFIEALNLYGRDWMRGAKHVGTRDGNHFRSHAQKFFIRLFKLGLPLPPKVAETGAGHTLSGKPLDPSSSAALCYLKNTTPQSYGRRASAAAAVAAAVGSPGSFRDTAGGPLYARPPSHPGAPRSNARNDPSVSSSERSVDAKSNQHVPAAQAGSNTGSTRIECPNQSTRLQVQYSGSVGLLIDLHGILSAQGVCYGLLAGKRLNAETLLVLEAHALYDVAMFEGDGDMVAAAAPSRRELDVLRGIHASGTELLGWYTKSGRVHRGLPQNFVHRYGSLLRNGNAASPLVCVTVANVPQHAQGPHQHGMLESMNELQWFEASKLVRCTARVSEAHRLLDASNLTMLVMRSYKLVHDTRLRCSAPSRSPPKPATLRDSLLRWMPRAIKALPAGTADACGAHHPSTPCAGSGNGPCVTAESEKLIQAGVAAGVSACELIGIFTAETCSASL
ncbi:Protein LHY [Porphyridium purpureum]|uniref:Protein LHY n=1 Tax=Porphyridium purpureum TaxID=35688 RepID=A0A5J4Z9J2_PORPP|nr:Protein LHY [Porphyridium purpureum]|eukprot:POR1594..scf295_1